MKKIKLLITGSNGLIAKSFIETYEKQFKIFTCTKKDSLDKILKNKIDVIINTAGEQYEENKMVGANLKLVIKLLNYCKKNKAKLVQFGSSAEYGVCNKPTNENFKLNPGTLYEATKSAASMMVVGFSKAYNVNAIVVRPYSVFGKYMKNDRLIKLIINSLNSNKKMNIYRAKHDFIYVKDFNKALKIIIEKNKIWNKGEIINIGSEKQLSNFQVLKTIQKTFKKKGRFKIVNKYFKPWDSDCWVSDCTHLKKKYKFKIEYNFLNAIKDLKIELGTLKN